MEVKKEVDVVSFMLSQDLKVKRIINKYILAAQSDFIEFLHE